MPTSRHSFRSRRGFTLLEILVALVLIGLLVGAVTPSVLSQIGKGEVNRLVEDLRSLETGAKLYRTDVSRWPRSLGQLAMQPAAGSRDLFRRPLSGATLRRWQGPYVERGMIAGDSVPSSGSAVVVGLDTVSWNGTPFVAFRVRGVDLEEAKLVSATLDGDTIVASPDPLENGRVRWTPNRRGTLVYLAAPAN
jgi:type II secretion system protein G